MSLELREWLKYEGGLSAYSIAWVMCPELRDFVDGCLGSFEVGYTPSDPSDFRRCREVLKLIPNGVARLAEVAAAFPRTQWPAFVAAWAELGALFEEESQRKDGVAPKLYKRISDISDGVDKRSRGKGRAV